MNPLDLVLQALKDAGLVSHIQAAGQAATATPAKESIEINYKDAPAPIQRQMEAQAGFVPSQEPAPSEIESHVKIQNTLDDNRRLDTEAALKARELEIKQQQANKPTKTNG